LDRTETLRENVMRVAKKLRMERACTQPLLYTQQGIVVEDVEEIIEGEVLLFEPRGKAFMPLELQKPTPETQLRDSEIINNDSAYQQINVTPLTSTSTPNSSMNSSSKSKPSVRSRSNSLDYDYMFKFIIVGNIAVGKSCILLRFTDKRFVTVHETTIGVDFGTEVINIGRGSDQRSVKVQIWDTAGQEDFQAITRAYYREAAAALVVYDISNRNSFEEVRNWIRNVRQCSTNRALTIALVGNKCDLDENSSEKGPCRVVSREEGETFARENGLLFFETSAKTGKQVREAFLATGNAVMRKLDLGLVDIANPSQGVRLGTSKWAQKLMAEKGGGAQNVRGEAKTGEPIHLKKRNQLEEIDDDERTCYCF